MRIDFFQILYTASDSKMVYDKGLSEFELSEAAAEAAHVK